MTVTTGRSDAPPDLGDRWSPAPRAVHLSGVQATIRVLVETLRADRALGRRTAAFVSGYQGSPLAGFDRELERALKEVDGVEIVHRPAVNEELGATAVMGSQLAGTIGSATHDGVLGVWYGKAPGLDRSMDALRHGNFAGAAALGGALVLVGDDPSAKSSTLPSASEAVLADLAMPTMFPRSLDQVLELGHHAVQLSRWSGAWTALKLVTSVADAEGTVPIVPWPAPILPDGYHAAPVTPDLLTPTTLARESVVLTERLEAAARYGDANRLNRLVVAPERARVALVAAGTVYSELQDALLLLGLDRPALERLGIALAEVRMPFPLGPGFARLLAGVGEVVVVEERREVVEGQLLSLLARRPGGPAVLGRFDQDGRPLVPRHGSLDATAVARVLGPWLRARFGDEVKEPAPPRRRLAVSSRATRVPWFCSGCPHSVSTTVPQGTLVGEGIGCHSIVHYMPEERVGHRISITQMGGEGAQWIGMAPFVGDRHMVQNLGDGTFFHSGQLALRAAVAAGVSITYKVLWNGATAMTGGQHISGAASSPLDLARMLQLEGVRQVVITTDQPRRYRRRRLPTGVTVRPREDVVAVQEELAAVGGVTVMIHDQACATELRRARKRGLAETPRFRVVINERVCEGCADCQVKSNCLSLQTVDTPFGPKTRIDPDSCNVDLSCLQGDCPAFTLVDQETEAPGSPGGLGAAGSPGGLGAAGSPGGLGAAGSPAGLGVAGAEPLSAAGLPPAPVAPTDRALTVRVVGIGGTGVVTSAHLLAWAALADGLEVWGLDQTGLSQKAGPVVSDLRIGPGAADRSNVVGDGAVDVLVASDLIAAVQPSVLGSISPGLTTVVGSTAATLSGPMVLGEQERRVPVDELREALARAARPDHATFVDATALVDRREAAAANVALLGVASQLGALPVSAAGIVTAIEQNGVAVEANLAAFRAGRQWVAGGSPSTDGPDAGRTAGSPSTDGPDAGRTAGRTAGRRGASAGLEGTTGLDLPADHRAEIGRLADDLVAYQGRRLAEQFLQLVAESWRAERQAGGDGAFAAAVAFGFHKLSAYKDEYEVARLLLEHPSSEGRTVWLLHPPALRARGLKRKIHLGPWARPAMRALRVGRRLRGTAIDPFGRTGLRRIERALPVEYAEAVRSLLPRLGAANLPAAVTIARLPDRVRGYEAVKEASVAVYRRELADRLAALPGG